MTEDTVPHKQKTHDVGTTMEETCASTGTRPCEGYAESAFDDVATFGALVGAMLRRGADKVQRQGQAEPASNLSAADIGIGDGCRLCIEENKFVVRSINCVGELPTTAHPNARKCDNCRTCRNIVRASRRYAGTTASHKHHERVVIAGKGVEALKLHVSKAARERNARRRLQRDGLRDSTKRIRQVVLHADTAAREDLKDDPVALEVWNQAHSNAQRTGKKSRGRRWHGAVLAFAFAILAKSNASTYDTLRNVFTLPSRRTLTESRSKMSAEPDGVQFGALRTFSRQLHQSGCPSEWREGVVAFDSCTIKGRIIYDPVSLKIKGVSNLEDVSVMRLAMQRLCDDDADDVDMNKHHLVFKWSSIHPDCNVSFILARFSLHTITADFYLMEFPKILRELATYELGLKVLVNDAATENVAFLKLVSRREDDVLVIRNRYTGDDIYVIADYPHVIKRIRNALESSSKPTSKRSLRIEGEEIGLSVIEKLWWRVRGGTRAVGRLTLGGEHGRCPLTAAHFKLDAWSRMRVPLATQMFCRRTQWLLREHGYGRHPHMLELMTKVDILGDVFNGRSLKEDPTCSKLTDVRQFFRAWREAIVENPAEGLPSALTDDVLNLCSTIIRLRNLYPWIAVWKLTQDPVEHHFNSARHAAGGSQAIDQRNCEVADATSQMITSMRAAGGNCSKAPFRIDPTTTLVDARECDSTRTRY